MKTGKIADAVVIGGGVVGTAIAYFLARKNIDVILVEKRAITAGTSGRCDGNVLVCDKAPGFDVRLNKLSLDLFPKIANELDYDIGWTQKGSLLAIENEKEMEAAETLCLQLSAEGLPVKILDKYEVHEDEPYLAPDIAGGIETDCDGSLNPMTLAYGLVHGAKKRGVKVLTHRAVTDIGLDADGCIERIVTQDENIFTRRVVNL